MYNNNIPRYFTSQLLCETQAKIETNHYNFSYKLNLDKFHETHKVGKKTLVLMIYGNTRKQ